MSTTDLELCRLCLTDEGVVCPIFGDEKSNLAQKIYDCTFIEIEQIDGVPSSICEICKSKLVICSQFIRQCAKTDEKVRKLYARHFESAKTEANREQQREDERTLNGDEVDIIDYFPFKGETQPNGDEPSLPVEENDEEEVYMIEIVEHPEEKDSEEQTVIEEDEKTIDEEEETENEITLKLKKPDSSVKDSTTSVEAKSLKVISQESDNGTVASPVRFKTNDITGVNGAWTSKKECPICGIRQQNLKQHMAVHSGVKKHVCQYCNKAFAQKGNLTCHLNIHTGNKPHQCDECGKSFGDPTALKLHKISHTDEPNFRCNLCDSTFKYRHSLQSHIRSHNDDRRHACSYCSMAFVTSSSLKKHIRKHTGERPYKCEQCPKSFTSGGNLQMHQKTHTRERPFQCTVCDACFGYKAVLKQHMKVHTKESSKNAV